MEKIRLQFRWKTMKTRSFYRLSVDYITILKSA